MKNESILLIGAGGHARACIDVIEQEDRFKIAGFIGLPSEVGKQILGYPVLGTDSDLVSLIDEYKHALIAIGQIKSPESRIRFFDLLEAHNCKTPTIVSPYAYVSSHAEVGAGTIIMHGAIVNAGATVGRNCIINSQALLEHDSEIADHCHISTSASLNSGVQVGQGTFIGSNASVRQSINIGNNCVIGMGQQVLADCSAGTCMPKKKVKP